MPPKRHLEVKSMASKLVTQDHAANTSSLSQQREHSATTPRKSPSHRVVRITQKQKQALIDNLQLEITERARKMRAQYALQAQGLKTRLEIRVHRIPLGLRSTTVGELLEKYSEQANIKLAPSMSVASPVKSAPVVKRKSDQLREGSADTAVGSMKTKRSRHIEPEPASEAHMSRGEVRRVPSSDILSPKSNNSQKLRQSPFKPTMSPTKGNVARPVSPLKPSMTAPTATSAAKSSGKTNTRAKASNPRVASKQEKGKSAMSTKQTQQKRVQPSRQADKDEGKTDKRNSNVSDSASSSAGTTIIRKTKGAATSSTISTGTRGKVAGVRAKFEGIAGTGKKVAPGKIAAAPSTGGIVKGGKTLRKRG